MKQSLLIKRGSAYLYRNNADNLVLHLLEFDNFNEIWNQALSWRREQRRVLKGIQEEMDGEQFTGRHARRLLFHSG
jgi:hypothetical protein